LLIERLTTLLQFLDGGPLPAVQHGYALDLLGVPTELRLPGRTILDPKPGEDPATAARAVLTQAVARLNDAALVQARADLDRRRRNQAMQGTPLKISKEMRLTKRYEAMHARRRREAWTEFLQIREAMRNWPKDVKEKVAVMMEKDRQKHQQEQQQAKERQKREQENAAPRAMAEQAQAAASAALKKDEPAPAAPAAAPKPAAASEPSLFNRGGKSKPSQQHTPPRRDREAERAAKKAERKERHKQQKKQRKQR
jgi:hypothetical protein